MRLGLGRNCAIAQVNRHEEVQRDAKLCCSQVAVEGYSAVRTVLFSKPEAAASSVETGSGLLPK